MMKSGYIFRNCPSCKEKPPLLKEVESAVSAETSEFADLIPEWNGFYRDKKIFSYVRCPACALLFAPTFFSSEQLSNLYAQMPPNMEEVPIDALRRTQAGYFQKLKSYTNLRGTFVEIGPDVGYFTENCVAEASFDEYWLLEPNVSVRAKLEANMGSSNHHIIHDMDGIQFVPEKSAEVVVMVHVLDHLLQPMAELMKIRSRLRAGGTLLIVTHDESSILRGLTGVKWPAFCLQHPQIYSPKSIEKMLSLAGFEVVEIAKTKNYFELGFLIKQALWLLGIRINRIPSFLGILIGLKLGNIITIARLDAGARSD